MLCNLVFMLNMDLIDCLITEAIDLEWGCLAGTSLQLGIDQECTNVALAGDINMLMVCIDHAKLLSLYHYLGKHVLNCFKPCSKLSHNPSVHNKFMWFL